MQPFLSKYTSFTFENYTITNDQVAFIYTVRGNGDEVITFTENITFPVELPDTNPQLQSALHSLHLALGISYYKLYLPPKIEVKGQKLTQRQADFWNKLYLNGLGEFLYVNKISPSNIAMFETTAHDNIAENVAPLSNTSGTPPALLGIGGGKDSIIAGEVLKELGISLKGFVVESGEEDPHSTAVSKEMGIEKLAIKRRLDPLLLELNKQPGALNGHIPISAIFAFAGATLAIITKSNYVVVGNESSASIPNTNWEGMEINHQWSKSFEFEKMAQDYIQSFISHDVVYFSGIRPLGTFGLCRLLSRMPDYFGVFTSCNRVARIDSARRPNNRWCGECAKCLSTYILLAPWLTKNELSTIFDNNLFNNEALLPLLLALTGINGIKPLDCVGTKEEILLALSLLIKNHEYYETPLMIGLIDNGFVPVDDTHTELTKMLRADPTQQAFPEKYKDELLKLLSLGELAL